MNNQEAKEKAIREAWESEGFVWDEIKHYLNALGDMTIPSPELKSEITGYADAINRRSLKGITLNNNGLWLKLERLNGISFNNGWNRIDGTDTLPKHFGTYTVLGKSGKIEDFDYDASKMQVWLEYFTHWRHVEMIPLPIY